MSTGCSIGHRRLKSRIALTRAAFLSIIAIGGPRLQAGFINVMTLVDTPVQYFGSVDHVAGGINPVAGGLVNWDRVINQLTLLDGDIGIIVLARHNIFGGGAVAPHAGDVNPNPGLLNTGILPVIPGTTMIPLTIFGPIDHPGNPHFNWLQFTYTPIGVGTSRLTIQLDHTETRETPKFLPEPSALTLLGIGLALICYGWWRKRAAS